VPPAPDALHDAKVERQAPGRLPATNDILDRGRDPNALRDVVCRTERQDRKWNSPVREQARDMSDGAVASRRDNDVGTLLEQSLHIGAVFDDANQLVATLLNSVANMVERHAVARILVEEERYSHARSLFKSCADSAFGRWFA
jgi:hypothetical protein